jgi:hypothetical protein
VIYLIFSGHIEVVTHLISIDVDLEWANNTCSTALIIATQREKLEIVKYNYLICYF